MNKCNNNKIKFSPVKLANLKRMRVHSAGIIVGSVMSPTELMKGTSVNPLMGNTFINVQAFGLSDPVEIVLSK